MKSVTLSRNTKQMEIALCKSSLSKSISGHAIIRLQSLKKWQWAWAQKKKHCHDTVHQTPKQCLHEWGTRKPQVTVKTFYQCGPVEVTVDLYINLHIHVCLYRYTRLRVPHTSPYFTHSHRAALCSTDAYLGPNFPFIDHNILFLHFNTCECIQIIWEKQ